ncbi:MAG: sarcosine oxidase subunit delta [Hyphomicrobium sp.]
MRINCPHCGERGLDEFAYHGDATVTRPDPAAPNAAEAFHDYGYIRRNPAGAHRELWYHASGCHAWLVVTRDTRTHRIEAVELAAKVARARSKAEGV